MALKAKRDHSEYAEIPYFVALTTYLGYAVLIVFGHLRDFLDNLLSFRPYKRFNNPDRRAPLLSDFEDFYTRRLYKRIHDCWGRPIRGRAGAWIDCLERVDDIDSFPSTRARHNPLDRDAPLPLTSRSARCLNLASYNYLGYAEVPGGVHPSVVDTLRDAGTSVCDLPHSLGRPAVTRRLERCVADFLGKDDATIVGMGFATNSQILPALVGPDDLIVSDALNHASIVVGARSSGAAIRVFEHNRPASLDATLRDAILTGNPKRNGSPWGKILILIEGMYSMEGETSPLREIVAIKKRYGAYLYLDEAHSIGALGATGRGATEHLGVDRCDVDIMMGTFTKSYGAVGGYVAADKAVIDRIRTLAPASLYASAMSPACAQHILWAFQQMQGMDGTTIGTQKIRALRENAIYVREALDRMGVQTLGDCDSPVIPIMLYNPAKIAAFSRECFQRGLAVVVVGFPATPLLLSRARICLSAAHTREDLDWALGIIDEVADLIQIKYDRPLLESLLPPRVANCLMRFVYNLERLLNSSSQEHCVKGELHSGLVAPLS